eukprot:scaffold25441_cov41-Attheya_sp.AAC.1
MGFPSLFWGHVSRNRHCTVWDFQPDPAISLTLATTFKLITAEPREWGLTSGRGLPPTPPVGAGGATGGAIGSATGTGVGAGRGTCCLWYCTGKGGGLQSSNRSSSHTVLKYGTAMSKEFRASLCCLKKWLCLRENH